MPKPTNDPAIRYRNAVASAKAGDYERARWWLKGVDHPKARALLAKVNTVSPPPTWWQRNRGAVVLLVVAVILLAVFLMTARANGQAQRHAAQTELARCLNYGDCD